MSFDPREGPWATFDTKPFFCVLDDGFELLTFCGEVDYRTDSEGMIVTDIRYWPRNEGMRESIEEWVSMNV